MTNYNDMTDEEIDIEITGLELRKKYPNAKSIEYDEFTGVMWVYNIGRTSYPLIHATSSWSDMGPIIERERIDVQWCGGGALCLALDKGRLDSFMFRDGNPLRAAAIVYLMMKEEG